MALTLTTRQSDEMKKTIPRAFDTCTRLSISGNRKELEVAAEGRDGHVVHFWQIACCIDCNRSIAR